jgi:hypothetical protein
MADKYETVGQGPLSEALDLSSTLREGRTRKSPRKSPRKWTDVVPKEEGWYWVRYRTKHGLDVMPAAVMRMHAGLVAVRTARMDTYYWPRDKDDKTWEIKFGPRLEPPEYP